MVKHENSDVLLLTQKTMLQILKLLLPALIPSWRFFDTIAPSPRIEFALLKTAQDAPGSWQEFRPRPAQLSMSCMLKRMFWNPCWNESLFLVSCAERLMEHPTKHSSQEILKRINAELEASAIDAMATPYLQFRVVVVIRDDKQLRKHITFISPLHHYSGSAVS
jgi:hypothetical protein